MDTPLPRDLVRRLLDVGPGRPPNLSAQILALGEDAVPPLIELVDDDGLAAGDASWGPIHAALLLGELRAVAAIPTLLRRLQASQWEDLVHDRALTSLGQMGAPALEPCLAAHASSDDVDFKDSLHSVLALLGVRDERIFALLLPVLDTDVLGAAIDLSLYGDPAALPHLSRAFDAVPIVAAPRGRMASVANETVRELKEAIERLGGQLTATQQAKHRRCVAADDRQRQLQRPAAAPAPPPGRNDPCPCGSGKKYKKCHLLEAR